MEFLFLLYINMELMLSLELWQCFVWLFDIDNLLVHQMLTVFYGIL